MKSLLILVCVLFVYTCAETVINFNFDGMIPPLPSCNCNQTVYCGDGVCNGDETNITCPNDCTVNQPVCGDRSCDAGAGEDPFTCPADCSRCGDAVCDNTENLQNCPQDCRACGDGFCSTGETLSSCPVDCANICGNGACETNESFGNCPADCQCVPQCSGRNCGDNGCGGSCGTCSGSDQCINGVCTAVCTPNCAGRNCGDNGCGGSCGTCSGTNQCVNGVCTAVCTPNCAGRNCGDNGCGGSCGTCSGTDQCINGVCTAVCTPNCAGRNCGSNGCGGSCGTCSGTDQCVNGVCTAVCTPNCAGRNCGDNGCGGSCGTCSGGSQCVNGVCNAVCTPNCAGRNCGDNGCGGSCGNCSGSDQCVNGVCTAVCTPNCAGRNCGDNGCGGSCGTCPTGQVCNNGACGVPSGTRQVTFSVVGINTGSVSAAAGVTVTSSLGTAVSGSSGTVTITVATNDSVTFSGAGFQSITIVVYGSSTSFFMLLPPTLGPNEVFTAALWDNSFGEDLDWNMFGPGNRTQYPAQEGVVNWAWIDKSLESPYASWSEFTSGVPAVEIIRITRLNTSATYDFMLFLWSRISGGDTSVTWDDTSPYVYLYGGSSTGLGSWAWHIGSVPTPPAGFEYGYWSPFSLEPSTSGLRVVTDLTPFEPAISINDINNQNQLFYPCDYPTYCPYPLP